MKTYNNVSEIPEGYVPLSTIRMERSHKNVLRTAAYEGRIQGCRLQKSGSRYTAIWFNAREGTRYLEEHQRGTVRSKWVSNPPAEPQLNWFQRVWTNVIGRLFR